MRRAVAAMVGLATLLWQVMMPTMWPLLLLGVALLVYGCQPWIDALWMPDEDLREYRRRRARA